MRSQIIPLCLLATLLLATHAHRPDTAPDPELRPLFLEDDTTQATITSMRYPIVLPRMPFGGEYEAVPFDYEDYVDEHSHERVPYVIGTIVPDGSSTVGYATDAADELDAQQERLENSTPKNCIHWGLAVTCLLYILSTFMLS